MKFLFYFNGLQKIKWGFRSELCACKFDLNFNNSTKIDTIIDSPIYVLGHIKVTHNGNLLEEMFFFSLHFQYCEQQKDINKQTKLFTESRRPDSTIYALYFRQIFFFFHFITNWNGAAHLTIWDTNHFSIHEILSIV